jgi:hypothetical protein
MELIPHNFPSMVSCDIQQARCQFEDNRGDIRSYDCLDMLALKSGEDLSDLRHKWQQHNDKLPWYYQVPIFGRMIASLQGAYDKESNIFAARAWQTRQMDRLWEADATGMIRPKCGQPRAGESDSLDSDSSNSSNSWIESIVIDSDSLNSTVGCRNSSGGFQLEPPTNVSAQFDEQTAYHHKKNMLMAQDQMMLCQWSASAGDWADQALMAAANISFCCRQRLSKLNPAQVFEDKPCEWSFNEMVIEWAPEYKEARIHVLGATVTLMSCRLGMALTELLIGRGRATDWRELSGTLILVVYYGFISLMLFSTWITCHNHTCSGFLGSSLQTMRKSLNSSLVTADKASNLIDLHAVDTARLFQWVAFLAILGEVVMSMPFFIGKLLLRLPCLPHAAVSWCAGPVATCLTPFQASYDKVRGNMQSPLWPKYTFFMVVMISCKCWFSYYYEIR